MNFCRKFNHHGYYHNPSIVSSYADGTSGYYKPTLLACLRSLFHVI